MVRLKLGEEFSSWFGTEALARQIRDFRAAVQLTRFTDQFGSLSTAKSVC